VFKPPLSFRGSGPDLRGLADEDLMPLIHDGDARAFEVMFDRHADAAFSLAYRMCGRRSTAEDIVQEAFVSLWRSGAAYDAGRGSVRSWVLGVVRNRAIDLFRRESVRTGRDVNADGLVEQMRAPDNTEAAVEHREDAQQIRAALQELPPDQRQVVELAYFGGFSHSQIASMLELAPGTVKGRMRLGLTKLRMTLGGPSEALI
jgi:RNA polymerase sigma-70 factor (ECF subfamily)